MCCGRGRQTIATSPEQPRPREANGAVARGLRVGIPFIYEGPTALTVTGPISGLIYRFVGRGARLIVDPRDGRALSSVPHLARSR